MSEQSQTQDVDLTEQPETPETTDQVNDDVYDAEFAAAFDEFFPTEEEEPEPDKQQAKPKETPAATPQEGISKEDKQLLKRLHVDPALLSTWPKEAQREFLENAAKRESDQTRTYQGLRDELVEIRKKLDGQTPDPKATEDTEPEAPAADSFEATVTQAVTEVVNVFGDDFQPFGEQVVRLAKTADSLQQRLDDMGTEKAQMGRLVVDLVIDNGLRDLTPTYPNLGTADARTQVRERFKDEWPNHAQSDGSLMERVRAALDAAASAVLGSPETAAGGGDDELETKTEQRLRGQPKIRHGRGRKPNPTMDDVYDEAFEEVVKPKL